MGALRIPLLICLILAVALCVLSEAKRRSKKGGKPREVKKPTKGNVAIKATSKHQAIINSAKKPQRTIPSVLASPKQLKETKGKRSKSKRSKQSKKHKKGGHSKKKHSREKKEHKHTDSSKKKPSEGNDARKAASKHKSILHAVKKPQRVIPSVLASTTKQIKPKKINFQKKNILNQVKNTKMGVVPIRGIQEKGKKTIKRTSQRGGHSKMKHSKEKHHSKESKEHKVKGHSKESKEHKEKGHSKGKHHHPHSEKSKEHKVKGHSKGKHHHHSKESKEKGHSKEKHHHHSKESKEKGHSKGKHHHHSKESKEKGHSKGKHHHHSKESKEKGHSKEKHHHHSKESKEKGHSKGKHHHHHSKENKKSRVSREKRHSNERIPKQEDKSHREVLCEWKRKTIKCDAGETLRVVSAMYGRKTKLYCRHKALRNLKCEAKSSMVKVSHACDGKDKCVLSATNSVFGDPCRGTFKYLDVTYECIKPEDKSHREVLCEWKTKTIKCDAGETQRVVSAMYGRKTESFCPHKALHNLNCEAKSSMVKVSHACDGKDKCVLSATNSVFGDPCRGTFKYLDVKYECIKPGVRYVSIKTKKQRKLPYVYTPLEKYGYTVSSKKSIELEVKACNDAHIALMGKTGENGKLYEIVIGGWGNTKSVIRTRKQGKDLYTRGGRRLNCRQYRKIKISWTGGLITVQINVNSVWRRFMRYKDPSPIDIRSVGVSTGIWATGEWRIAVKEDKIHRELLCEWKMKTINCDAGETIKIMSAMYGRKTRSLCPHAAMSNLKCEAKSSMGKVSQACDGKNKCVLSATNSVFGDPCGGTFKYLDVKYACVNTGVRYVSIKTKKQRKLPYVYTPLEKYGYTVSSKTSIELEVKACNDAHIALMGKAGENGKLYEIVIGGWGNTKSVIRTRKQGKNLYTRGGRRLDCRKYRKIKISWTGGLITVQIIFNSVWRGFLRYKDPSPIDIRSVGVSTGIWATGEWRIAVKDDDKCNGRDCHANALCTRDGCVCKRGYYGDGYNSCEKSCLCMASGDPHYRTFDGQMIHFMGTCRYTLTRSLDRGGKCAFNVEVKNERRGRNTRVAFTRYVDVEVYGRKIRLHQNKKVFIDNERRYLPVKELQGRLTVTFSGRYVQIWTKCGLLVNFDGNHAVSVVVPKSFSGNLTGLCGDCDGKMNDFRTRNGNDVTKKSSRYNLIGNSYKVLEHGTASNPSCVPVPQDSPKCDSSLANRLNRREYCGEITEKTGRFAKCISRFPVQAKSFFDSCVFDLCSFQGEPHMMSKVRCNSVEAFAEECEENGIIVNWRSKEFCPLTCEDPNMVYKANAPGCPSTCVDPEAPSSCTLEPREGCVCKDGFALSDGQCISLSQCGCVDSDGAYFPLNTRKSSQDCGTDYVCKRKGLNSRLVPIRSGRKCHKKAQCTLDKNGERKCVCNQGYEGDGYSNCKPLCGMKFKCHPQASCRNGRCKCKRGLSGDGVRECKEMCICGASGDPHYRTFDGQMIHFMGICKYLLTQTTPETDPCKISVQVSNERRGRNRRVSFTKSVHVKVYGKKIVMKEDKRVFIDGEQKYLPVREENGNLTIFISGKNVRLVTACGHRVYWDGRSVARVSVPKSYAGKLTGLCGDCNGKKDDFRTKNGLDVSKKKNRYSIIGNSYMKGRRFAEDTENCVTVEDDVRCSKHMTESASKGDHCGYINPRFGKVSPFQSCVKENPAMALDLFNACKFDVCAYFDDPTTRRDVVCRSLEALEAECETEGFSVKWRSSDFCPMTCPKNMRYSSAVSGCPATCLTPDSEEACVLDDTEGCECLPGFLLSGTDCVPVEQCGCLTPKGDYLPLGTQYVSDDCTTVTKCTNENGEAILERVTISERCHKDGMCGVVDGYHQCKCKDGFHGDGIESCLPMCGGRFKCHVDAECQNGECVCKAGKYGDGINKCYDACVCSASGDPHYYLFDRQTIHFMGNCKYLLSKLSDNKTCGFDVQVENEHGHNQKHVSYTRSVNIKIGQQSISLLQGRKLQIDDVLTFTPYEDPKGRFVVVIKGRYITLIGRCGLVVMFDGNHAVSVTVPRELGKTLTGICGNCNGKSDDFKTKNGRDVSTNPNKFVSIGNSYEVTDVTDGAKKGCKSDDYKVSCSKDWERRIESEEFCGKLQDKKGLFGKCVKMEPKFAQSFFASCRMDLCAAEGDEMLARNLLCQSLEAFADNCQMNGVTNKQWRTMNICPLKCSSSEVYSPAIVANPSTCDDPDASASYSLAPVEGCTCKEGYVLSGIKCVRQRDCGCFYNRKYFPVNGTGPLTNCEREQTCVHKDGLNSMEIVERKLSCRRNAECRNVDGVYKCKCREGFKGNNNTGCKEIKVKKPTSPNPSAKPTPAKSTTKPKASSLPSLPQATTKPSLKPTSKPSTKPPNTPKPKPQRPKYVPYSQCKISMKHQSCGSSLTLSGACQYRSQFSDQCRYSVLMLKLGTKIFAKVQINKRVRILRHGKKFSDCASFHMVNSTVTITDNVCEKCTLEFIRNITPRHSCKAPKG